jgi:uncharacterized RDD family membrane protein YckC
MTSTPPTDPTTAALDRMASSYVPTTGKVGPTFKQRRALKRPPRPLPGIPSSLGRRLAARLIDSAVVLVVAAGVLYELRRESLSDVVGLPLFLGILFGYEFLAVTVFGRTLGKWFMELRVMRVNGYRAPWWSAALRAFLPFFLNIATLGVFGTWCYLSPIMDDGEWGRGWHDRAARTVVVHQLS